MTKTTGRTRPLALGYIRVSTAEQADSRLGLDAQREQLTHEAEGRGWDLVIVADEGITAKHTRRPGFQDALARLKRGEADVLLASKVDRVSRSTLDFLQLVERSDREGWQLAVLNFPELDPTNPFSKVARTIQAAFAELERDLISLRTREALAQLKAQGVDLGQQTKHSDATLARILGARAAGESYGQIAADLNRDRVPTSKGGVWYPATVKRAAESIRAARLAEAL